MNDRGKIVTNCNQIVTHGVDFVTLGQYMRPTKQHLSIKEYVTPAVFAELGAAATDLGFLSVASGPLVRSSYRAREFYEQALARRG